MRVVTAVVVAAIGCGRYDFVPLGDGRAGDGVGDTDADTATIHFVSASTLVAQGAVSEVTTTLSPRGGTTIVVYAWSFALGGSSGLDGTVVHDTAGNSYSSAIAAATTGNCSGGKGAAAIHVAFDVPAATDLAITVTPTGAAGQEIAAIATEWSGVTTFDGNGALETPAGSSPLAFASGSVGTSALAGSRLVAVVANECSGNPDQITWSEVGNFTPRAVITDTVAHQPGWAGDKVVPPGSYAEHWTVTYPNTANYASLGVIAALR